MSGGALGIFRVFASRVALEGLQLNPLSTDDLVAIFTSNRLKIEKAASAKFDREGTSEAERYDGQPMLTVQTDDFH
jgi:hypothetical protein